MLGERLREPCPDFRPLVRIVDLVAAQAPADPRLGHALRIADRHALGLERQVARRRRPGIEVLVEPEVWRHDHRALAPVVALRLLALGPHQAEALAAQDDDMRPGAMGMGLLVGADRELRNVAVHRAFRHAEARMPAAGAALLRREQGQVDRIGDEVRVQQQPLLLALVGEIFRLAVEALFEVVVGVEDKIEIAEGVDDDRRVGHGDVARGVPARAVEMLVPGIERNSEDRPRLPLEADALSGLVPDRGRAAAVEHVDHLLVQLPLRREALPGRDLADIAVVRGTRRVVIQENRPASPPRPGLELYRVQVRNVERADDLQPLVAHPARVRRLFLGDELVREFF